MEGVAGHLQEVWDELRHAGGEGAPHHALASLEAVLVRLQGPARAAKLIGADGDPLLRVVVACADDAVAALPPLHSDRRPEQPASGREAPAAGVGRHTRIVLGARGESDLDDTRRRARHRPIGHLRVLARTQTEQLGKGVLSGRPQHLPLARRLEEHGVLQGGPVKGVHEIAGRGHLGRVVAHGDDQAVDLVPLHREDAAVVGLDDPLRLVRKERRHRRHLFCGAKLEDPGRRGQEDGRADAVLLGEVRAGELHGVPALH
mmetsp:Transcript_11035/g.29439  ORF Transcript_11035/g.29439 Transcript_11035/m.29439 type:complete len:260 (+) Transcript_11035:298-1077(+)